MASTQPIDIMDCGKRSRLTAFSIAVGILFDEALVRRQRIEEIYQTLLDRGCLENGAKSELSQAKPTVLHLTFLLPVAGCRFLTSPRAETWN